jgi:hypothetical protein
VVPRNACSWQLKKADVRSRAATQKGRCATAPAGLVPVSFAITLFRFANFAFIYFKKPGWALPVKSAISLFLKNIQVSSFGHSSGNL